MTTPLTATDLHIAQLLTGGVSVQRILAIGRYRAAWGPDDVAYVRGWLADRTVEREVERDRLAAEQQRERPPTIRHAQCGTTAGARKHQRDHERLCEPCRVARNAYQNERRRKTRAS
jgi:hypothetical protein